MGFIKSFIFYFNFTTSISFIIKLFSGDQTTLNYLFQTVLFDYSLNTFYLILLTSITALVIGIFPAWVISNYNFYGRKFFDIVLYLPLAIPAYIMAFTYIDILNYTGPFQTFLRNYSFLPSDFLMLIICKLKYWASYWVCLYTLMFTLRQGFLLVLSDQIILMFQKT